MVCGLGALLLYVATCSPGVEWQDSGIHQYRIVTGLLEHPRGLALCHPLHYWFGRAALAIPLGEPALRLNLISSLFGALGIGMLATLLRRLTARPVAAYVAAAAVLVAHSYWQMSALTESYTISGALLTIEWYLLWRYGNTNRPILLLAVFAVNGLHVADHLLGLLSGVTYVFLALERTWRGRLRWTWLPGFAFVWIATASPYWILALSHYHHTGSAIATVRSALFGGDPDSGDWSSAVLNVRLSWAQLQNAVVTFGYCFPFLTVPVALVGILRRSHRRIRVFRRVLLAQTVIIGAFVLRYTIADLYTYFVPICLLVGLWFGIGLDRWLGVWTGPSRRWWLASLLAVNALVPPALYVAFPIVAARHHWLQSKMRHIAFRDEYVHFFRPWRMMDDSPTLFSRTALDQTGPGGWLLADSTTAFTAAYFYHVHGGPGGIRIYAGRHCVNVPGWKSLSNAELAAFVNAGGHAVVVPQPKLDPAWNDLFTLDEATAAPFWLLLPRRAGQTDPDRVDFAALGQTAP